MYNIPLQRMILQLSRVTHTLLKITQLTAKLISSLWLLLQVSEGHCCLCLPIVPQHDQPRLRGSHHVPSLTCSVRERCLEEQKRRRQRATKKISTFIGTFLVCFAPYVITRWADLQACGRGSWPFSSCSLSWPRPFPQRCSRRAWEWICQDPWKGVCVFSLFSLKFFITALWVAHSCGI